MYRLFLDFTKEKKNYHVSGTWLKNFFNNILGSLHFSEGKSYNLSVAFVGSKNIRRVNHVYRDKDAVTDVISVAGENEDFPSRDIEKSIDLGEIIICFEQTQKQAKEHGVSWRTELEKLLIHGFLHNQGHDHERDNEAGVMESLERKLMRKF